MTMRFVVVAFALIAGIAGAQGTETPYSGDAAVGGERGTFCGFMETNGGDPAWVLATSDRILRANLCVASPPCGSTQWYEKVFAPCYGDVRYFKLEPNAKRGQAFTMAGFGVGTFDGMCARWGALPALQREHARQPLWPGPDRPTVRHAHELAGECLQRL